MEHGPAPEGEVKEGAANKSLAGSELGGWKSRQGTCQIQPALRLWGCGMGLKKENYYLWRSYDYVSGRVPGVPIMKIDTF